MGSRARYRRGHGVIPTGKETDGGPSRENGRLEELSHLRKKVGSLEVMLQKMSLERELTSELEEEGMESFLRRIAAEYV